MKGGLVLCLLLGCLVLACEGILRPGDIVYSNSFTCYGMPHLFLQEGNVNKMAAKTRPIGFIINNSQYM